MPILFASLCLRVSRHLRVFCQNNVLNSEANISNNEKFLAFVVQNNEFDIVVDGVLANICMHWRSYVIP